MPRLPRPLVPLLVAVVAAACGGEASGSGNGDGERVTLRLGYFANVTHATAIVGLREGTFAQALGPDVELDAKVFNAGPEVTEALFAGALDASYVGPNPALNASAKSDGKAIRIVAGATSGGAFLVTRPSITRAAQLRGKKLATPQLGNTQDVALRAWLDDEDLETTTAGGGDVSIVPQANAETLTAFKAGDIDGAWVPEPWATRLVQEGGGRVLVDEADLWPDGRYVTTHLVVRTEFLDDHPDVVKRLLVGHVDATQRIAERPDEAKSTTNDGIESATGKRLPDAVIDQAWQHLEFTVDPIAGSLEESAADAAALELLERIENLPDIYSLDALNAVLAERGDEEVRGL